MHAGCSPKYCCIFDVTHEQARLVQQAIDGYSGDWMFSKKTDSNTAGAGIIFYSSRLVNVIILKNPDKTMQNCRKRKSYARLTIVGYYENDVGSFIDLLGKSVPEINKRNNSHSIRRLGVHHPETRKHCESIDAVVE